MSKLFRHRKAPEGKTNSPSDLTPSGPSAEASAAREGPVTHRRHLRNLFGPRKSEKQNQPTKEAVQIEPSSSAPDKGAQVTATATIAAHPADSIEALEDNMGQDTWEDRSFTVGFDSNRTILF